MANFVTDPGYAASSVLEDFLTKREAEKRQSMLDAITMRKEARLEQHDAADLEIKREQLQALRDNRTQTQGDKAAKVAQDVSDKELTGTIKEVDRLSPGDIPDKTLQDRARRVGLPMAMKQVPPEIVPAGSNTPILPSGPTPVDLGMATVPEPPPQLPGAQPPLALKMAPTYAGSPQQREAIAKRDRIQTLIDSLPEGSAKKEAEFQQAGITLPAGALDKATKSPELGTFGDYLSRVSGGHPEALTPAQIEVARKKWGDEGRITPREPSPQPQIFVGPDGKSHAVQFSGGQAREIPLPMEGLQKGAAANAQETASTRTMREGAQHLLPQIDTLRSDAKKLDASGQFGPVASRIRNIMASVGATLGSSDPDVAARAWTDVGHAIDSDPALNSDRLVGKFATELGLMATAAGRVHGGARGGGSVQMLDHFKSLLSANSTLDMFEGRLDALQSYMETYAKTGAELKAGSNSAAPKGSGIKSVTEIK